MAIKCFEQLFGCIWMCVCVFFVLSNLIYGCCNVYQVNTWFIIFIAIVLLYIVDLWSNQKMATL